MTTRLLCAASLLLVSCTDAATRVAYDIEAGAKRFRKTPTVVATVEHSPKARPEGCPGGYTLQLSEESALQPYDDLSPELRRRTADTDRSQGTRAARLARFGQGWRPDRGNRSAVTRDFTSDRDT
jgi:hypothetical protein